MNQLNATGTRSAFVAAAAVAGLVEGDRLHLRQPVGPRGRAAQLPQPAVPPARAQTRRSRRRVQVGRPRDGDILRGARTHLNSTHSVPL